MNKDSHHIIEVKDLHISFEDQEVVKGINFSLARGETLGIVGESGSGKSVTVLSLMGLLPEPGRIRKGNISFQPSENADDPISLNAETLSRVRGKEIAMIFQEPSTFLNPVFTCGSQVSEVITLHKGTSVKESESEVFALFHKVGLTDAKRIYDSYPHQLSGGQKQRILIAMAIACNPKVLIADEPTTALDVTVQREILDLLIKLQAETQMSMIFISHDLGVVGEVADRILVLSKGEQIELEPTEKLFSSPQEPYTKGLLACRPPLSYKPRRLLTIEDFTHEGEVPESEEALKKEFSGPPILKVNHLKTWFRRKSLFWQKPDYVKAVDGVSFEIFAGMTLGLVGESGCGKSTLSRSVLRLIEIKEGEIYFNGKGIHKLSGEELRKERKNIQIIFQDPFSSLNPRIQVGKTLMEPMRVYGIGKSDSEREILVRELLEKVQLSPALFYRYPHQLSGGQRQRVSIARALSLQPKVIICDEIVSALDVSIQAKILNLLKDLQEELDLAYLFISHDMSVVRYMSDRIMVMKDGVIVEEGKGENIYQAPAEAYTKGLLEVIPEGTIEAVQKAQKKRDQLKIKKG